MFQMLEELILWFSALHFLQEEKSYKKKWKTAFLVGELDATGCQSQCPGSGAVTCYEKLI
jgi:hypothetical protein